jgi:hypothetical protein
LIIEQYQYHKLIFKKFKKKIIKKKFKLPLIEVAAETVGPKKLKKKKIKK